MSEIPDTFEQLQKVFDESTPVFTPMSELLDSFADKYPKVAKAGSNIILSPRARRHFSKFFETVTYSEDEIVKKWAELNFTVVRDLIANATMRCPECARCRFIHAWAYTGKGGEHTGLETALVFSVTMPNGKRGEVGKVQCWEMGEYRTGHSAHYV